MQNLLRFLSDVRVAAAASFIAGLITEAVFALWYDVFGLLLGGYDEAVRQQHLAFGLVGIVGGIIACLLIWIENRAITGLVWLSILMASIFYAYTRTEKIVSQQVEYTILWYLMVGISAALAVHIIKFVVSIRRNPKTSKFSTKSTTSDNI